MESKTLKTDSDSNYAPFITDDFVFLPDGIDGVPVKILRDTGLSFILESILPFSATSSAEKNVLIRGIGLQGCTDYCKLNKITSPDAFPLPRMEDYIDQVGTSKFVSKLDLLKEYWQVPLTKCAQEVTTFTTPSGLYSYSVMSFGLRNATATFQR